MSGEGSKTHRKQVLFGLSADFAQLSAGGVSGYPGAAPAARPLFCANPEVTITRSQVTTQAVRSRISTTTPIATTWDVTAAVDVYARGADGEGFDTAEFDLLKLFMPVIADRTGRPAYSVDAWTATTVTLDAPAEILPGEGFEIIPPTGGGTWADRAYVRYCTAVDGAVITFTPALKAEIVALLNAAGGQIGYGRTHAFGESTVENGYLACPMEGITKEVFGIVPNTMTWNLTAGEPVTVRCAMVAPYGKRSATVAGSIGATVEPAGDWLKFLNADHAVADSDQLLHPRSMTVEISHDPQRNVTGANALGVSGMKRGAGAGITMNSQWSGYDLTQDQKQSDRSRGVIAVTLGSGRPGNSIGLALMSAGRAEVTDGEENGLLTQGVTFVADEYNGDAGGAYDGGVRNSIARVFVSAGV